MRNVRLADTAAWLRLVAVIGLGSMSAACSESMTRLDYPFFGGEPPPSIANRPASDYAGALPKRPQAEVETASLSAPQSPDRVSSAPLAPPSAMRANDDCLTVTAKQNDSVYDLSRRYGISARTIFAANSMQPDDPLRPGQQVCIPTKERLAETGDEAGGTAVLGIHRVQAGETLPGIAQRYKVSIFELADLNSLKTTDPLRAGQDLKIPASGKLAERPGPVRVASLNPAAGAESAVPIPAARPRQAAPQAAADKRDSEESGDQVAVPAPPAPRSTAASRAAEEAERAGTTLKRRELQVASRTPAATPVPMSSGKLRWPVRGRIISEFGSKPNGAQNDGINIAVPSGTSIKAAENGVVAYVGNELKGYGNLILIRHQDDLVTAYAHAGEISVSKGQQVARGQIIGKAGQTGSVNRPQLHFEVRKGAKPVDPMKYLTDG